MMRLLVAALLLPALLFAAKDPPTQPVNINTASAAELQKLPGIGPATARSIVRYRERNGPFRRVEELLIIRGISRSRLKALRPYITVESPKPKEGPKSKVQGPRSR